MTSLPFLSTRAYTSLSPNTRKILESCQIPREANVACRSAPHSEKIPEREMNKEGGSNLLQAVQRYLEELKVEHLKTTEITQLENRLDAILHQLRVKKVPGIVSEGTYITDTSCYCPYPSQEDNDPLLADDLDEYKMLPAIEDTILFW